MLNESLIDIDWSKLTSSGSADAVMVLLGGVYGPKGENKISRMSKQVLSVLEYVYIGRASVSW